MKDVLDYAGLKARHRELRHNWPEPVRLRIHRAISWVGRAEASRDDGDARFIFLWIAFNAAYANEQEGNDRESKEKEEQREIFGKYFETLDKWDNQRRIYVALRRRFKGPIKLLMKNQYVFNPFWKYHNGAKNSKNWKEKFRASKEVFDNAYKDKDVPKMLSFVFDRLYVLRNQIMHGGSTWNSDANRSQVRDGVEILEFLIPVFIDIMMDHPEEDYWGTPFYPVVE